MNKLSQGSYSVNFADYVRNLEKQGMDIIKLQTGDPFFSTHPSIILSASTAMKSGRTKYCDSRGLPQFREAICQKLQSANLINASEENVLVTHGAVQGLSVVLQHILSQGDECIVLEPFWRAYEANIKINQGTPKIITLDSTNNFALDVAKIKSQINRRTKAIIINTPNNPSGSVYKASELKKLHDLAAEEDIFIISDEVYESITFDANNHFSIGSIEAVPSRVISLFSFSKTYSMTGWRIGYVSASKGVIDELLTYHQFNITSVPEFRQLACLEALQSSESSSYVSEMNNYYSQNRALLINRIRGTWLEPITTIPQGAFYSLIEFNDGKTDPLDLAKKIVTDIQVSLTPGIAFGDKMSGFLRLCFACERGILEEALERLIDYKKM